MLHAQRTAQARIGSPCDVADRQDAGIGGPQGTVHDYVVGHVEPGTRRQFDLLRGAHGDEDVLRLPRATPDPIGVLEGPQGQHPGQISGGTPRERATEPVARTRRS